MTTGPMDAGQAAFAARQSDLTDQKLRMDALRKRLASGEADDAKLREACEGFESVFINKLWTQMRATVPKEGYLHSKEEEQYLSMFDQELSKKLASAGGIGLGDMLYEQLRDQLARASSATSSTKGMEPLPVTPLREPEPKPLKPVAKNFDDSPDNLYSPADETVDPAGRVLTRDNAQDAANNAATQVSAAIDPRNTREQAKAMTEPDPAALTVPENSRRVLREVDDLARQIEVTSGSVGGEGGPAPTSRPGLVERMRGAVQAEPLHWPVQGRVSSDFGWRRDPFTGQKEWHAGVDLAANMGSTVEACWDGRVVFAGERGGYGKLVVLEHPGGWKSYYGHNSELDVQEGDSVRAGHKIAEVGSTGRSTGAHLHFELRQGDQAWNPAQIRRRLNAGLPIGNPSV